MSVDLLVFGPHPDDRPWLVAPPGGTNNREFSRWVSKTTLPNPNQPGKVPPVYFTVSLKAWPRGAITRRMKDEVAWREDHVLDGSVSFALMPVKLAVGHFSVSM